MDRRYLRDAAKKEYKKMMKTMPAGYRLPFAQMFPLIKQSILAKSMVKHTEVTDAPAEVAQEDLTELTDMLVAGPVEA